MVFGGLRLWVVLGGLFLWVLGCSVGVVLGWFWGFRGTVVGCWFSVGVVYLRVVFIRFDLGGCYVGLLVSG